MRIRIDASKCQGTGTCMKLLPQVFRLDRSDGPVTVLDADPDRALEELTREAESLCPTSAIRVDV